MVDDGPDEEWPEERRQDPRATVATSAIVLVRQNDGVGLTIESLSVGGARLSGPVSLDPGERLQVLFEIDGRPVEVRAEVVRVEKEDMMTDRISVRFVDLPEDMRELIQMLVRRALEQEERLRESEFETLDEADE